MQLPITTKRGPFPGTYSWGSTTNRVKPASHIPSATIVVRWLPPRRAESYLLHTSKHPNGRFAVSGLHELRFASGSRLLLSDVQIELFTKRMGVDIPSQAVAKLEMYLQRRGNWSNFFSTPGLACPPMCAWNMVLRRRCVAGEGGRRRTSCASRATTANGVVPVALKAS